MLALIAGNRSVDPDAINHNAGDKSRIVDPTTGEVVDVFNATAAYDFTITDAQKGLYDLDIKAAGLDDNTDSFWVQLLQQTAPGIFTPLEATLTDNLLAGNNNGLAVFTNHTGIFEWLNAGLWDCSPAPYRIQITMRESGVGIDQIRIGQYQQAPGDDRVDINSIGGIVEINGGSGDDSFYVNYDANGVQTDENGIGITRKDTFSGTGSRTIFGLAKALATTQLLSVVVNGEALTFDQYTVDLATSTVTFLTAPAAGATIEITYLVSSLLLHGMNGSDSYVVGLAGSGDAVINVTDRFQTDTPESPLAHSIDRLTVNGTAGDDDFLVRPHLVVSFSQTPEGNRDQNHVERVNYDGNVNGGLILNGRAGDDSFTFDDNDALTTVNGDAGNDRFQVGQIYESQRLANANLQPVDQFQTTLTTRGYLSNGISVAATLNGGDGEDEFDVFHALASLGLNGGRDDDRFTVRAFVTVNEGSTKERFSNVNGGDGADFISYAVNAPINIDGGEGFDTVTILGTEFGDSFVVGDNGTWGAGLYISYTGIEQLEVNGGEGNDTFYIVGTSANMSTVVLGGLGSDTFNVAGRPNRLDPLTATSNDLQGHSGVITQSIESGDRSYDSLAIDGIAANVYDNDEAGVMIRQSNGFTRVTEQSGSTTPNPLQQDEYWVVLTKAPDEVVRITISPAATSGDGRGVSVNPDPIGQLGNPATTLVFTTRNWFIPQRVIVTGLPDAVAEGTEFIPIQQQLDRGRRRGRARAADDGRRHHEPRHEREPRRLHDLGERPDHDPPELRRRRGDRESRPPGDPPRQDHIGHRPRLHREPVGDHLQRRRRRPDGRQPQAVQPVRRAGDPDSRHRGRRRRRTVGRHHAADLGRPARLGHERPRERLHRPLHDPAHAAPDGDADGRRASTIRSS